MQATAECSDVQDKPAAGVPTVQAFLAPYRVERGQPHTHTTLGRCAGAFYLPAAQHDAFLDVYRAAVERGDDALSVTERHRHIGPVVVDLDLRYDPDASEQVALLAARDSSAAAGPSSAAAWRPRRRHGDAEVRALVEIYARHIASYVCAPSDGFDAVVLEKPGATAYKGAIKDGLHLVFPEVVTPPAVQHLIRRAALPEIAEVVRGFGAQNRVDDVVDEAVVERNNWMMHGSRKPGGEAYDVTRVFRWAPAAGLVETWSAAASGGTPLAAAGALVSRLSIRNKYAETPTRADRAEEVDAFVSAQEVQRQRRELFARSPAAAAAGGSAPHQAEARAPDDEFQMAVKLVGLLSKERAETYADWIRVGFCLHNIDHRLLDAWVTFSQRSDKFLDGECPRYWASMGRGALGMGSLRMWARQDAPEQFQAMLRCDLRSLIMDSLNATHTAVAAVVYHMYRYQYACASIRYKTWYEYRGHRWHECDSAVTLRQRISSEVFQEYNAIIMGLRARIADAGSDSEQQSLVVTCKRIDAVALRLKTTAFKENVVKECAELFYAEGFESRLDANPSLIGFENGVYDLDDGEFRDGRPDDYLSFSTGIHYVPYRDDHPRAPELHDYFAKVHPDPAIRDYVLKTFASCLSGTVREERFHVWTGSGSNSKSVAVSLFEKSFGPQYCCKLPVSLLTQKRVQSSAATPEIARARGRRFAVLQEPSEDEKLNVGLMKELSGGDTIMTRELFKAPVEWKPQFKLVLCCNQLPNVPSTDGGTWRRIRVVEWGSKFCDNPDPADPRQFALDPALPAKLNLWREVFIAYLIDRVYPAYLRDRAPEPEDVLRCTREYQRNNDVLADFSDACVERGDPAQDAFTVSTAWRVYREWAREERVGVRIVKADVKAYLDRTLQRSQMVSGHPTWRGFRVGTRRDGGGGAALDALE